MGKGTTGLSNPWPRMAMNAAQHEIINFLKHDEIFLFSLVFMYLMCGPRQLFLFQCGPEMPKGWTPLRERKNMCAGFFILRGFICFPKVLILGEVSEEDFNRISAFQVCPLKVMISTDWLAVE